MDAGFPDPLNQVYNAVRQAGRTATAGTRRHGSMADR